MQPKSFQNSWEFLLVDEPGKSITDPARKRRLPSRIVGIDQYMYGCPGMNVLCVGLHDQANRRTVHQLRCNQHQAPRHCIRLKHCCRAVQPVGNLLPNCRRHVRVVVLSGAHLALGQVDRPISKAQQAQHVRAVQHAHARFIGLAAGKQLVNALFVLSLGRLGAAESHTRISRRGGLVDHHHASVHCGIYRQCGIHE
ncbi:hypothetical protein D3C72_570890 [compost metagenome]